MESTVQIDTVLKRKSIKLRSMKIINYNFSSHVNWIFTKQFYKTALT